VTSVNINRPTAAVDPATTLQFEKLTSEPRVDVSPRHLHGVAGVPEVSGDHLNAQRFLATYGSLVRRSPELGRWYIWGGSWWIEDRLDQVLELAATTIDDLRQWVGEAETADEFKRRSAHYTASAKAGRRDALLDLAGTDPDVVVSVEQLDAHPMLLACNNGTVDLQTGELARQPRRPHHAWHRR
jgi:phage/plasmid-associated DNA primase